MELKVVTDSDKEFVMSIDKYIDDTGYSNRVLQILYFGIPLLQI